jgi:hypothetical protein
VAALIIIGMIVLFVLGAGLFLMGVIVLMYSAAWSSRIETSAAITSLILFVIGSGLWYLIFSNLTIGLG